MERCKSSRLLVSLATAAELNTQFDMMETKSSSKNGNVFANLRNFLLYSLWLFFHFAYETTSLVLEWGWGTLKNIKNLGSWRNGKEELINLAKRVQTFQKIPKHLAISVVLAEEEVQSHQDKVNLVNRVSEAVSWAYAVNVRVVSLYDEQGILKTLRGKLRRTIQKDITKAKQLLQSQENEKPLDKIVKELSLVKIHSLNGNKPNGEMKDLESSDTLNIFLFSRDDGKPMIIEAVKDIYFEKCSNKTNGIVPSVTEKQFDTYISQKVFGGVLDSLKVSTEPDLLMVFGKVKSTLGFLPWHIRLTEIHWMPPIHKADLSDFQGSLAKYSGCQQRFGK